MTKTSTPQAQLRNWEDNLRQMNRELLEALENIECPECNHILKFHADRYGCEVDRGDREIGGILQAAGPCGCNAEYGPGLADIYPDLTKAILVLRKIKGAQ
jgi:hypothetical protein